MPDSSQAHGLQPTRLLCPWNFSGKNTGVGCHSLLQGILPTQGSNLPLLCLSHWQADLLPLNHLGSPHGWPILMRRREGSILFTQEPVICNLALCNCISGNVRASGASWQRERQLNNNVLGSYILWTYSHSVQGLSISSSHILLSNCKDFGKMWESRWNVC